MADTEQAVEKVARAIYEQNPAEDKEVDLDGRPTGTPYEVPWDSISEQGGEAHAFGLQLAQAAISAYRDWLHEEGYVVVPREAGRCVRLAMFNVEPFSNSASVSEAVERINAMYRAMITAGAWDDADDAGNTTVIDPDQIWAEPTKKAGPEGPA